MEENEKDMQTECLRLLKPLRPRICVDWVLESYDHRKSSHSAERYHRSTPTSLACDPKTSLAYHYCQRVPNLLDREIHPFIGSTSSVP